MTGALTHAFQKARLFRSGAVLTGSAAYLIYGAILGFKASKIKRRRAVENLPRLDVAAVDFKELDGCEIALGSVEGLSALNANQLHSKTGLKFHENSRGYMVEFFARQSDAGLRSITAIDDK